MGYNNWSGQEDDLPEGFDPRLVPFLGLKNRGLAAQSSSGSMGNPAPRDITQPTPVGLNSYQETDNPYNSPEGDNPALASRKLSIPNQQLPLSSNLGERDPSGTPAMDKYRDFLNEGTPDREKLTHQNLGQRLATALAGGAIAYGNGAGAGLKAMEGVKNSEYNDALNDYKLKANTLGAGADLEEKQGNTNFSRSAKMREILDTEANNARLDRTADDEHRNYNSLIAEREANMGSQGWNFATRETDGHRIGTRMGPSGPMTMDLGKYSESPDEKGKRAISQFTQESDVTKNREVAVGDHARSGQLANDKLMADYHNDLTKSNDSRKQLEAQARDAANPNRQFTARILAAMDAERAHPEIADKIEKGDNGLPTGKWDKSIDGIIQAELKKFNPSGPTGAGSKPRFSLVP